MPPPFSQTSRAARNEWPPDKGSVTGVVVGAFARGAGAVVSRVDVFVDFIIVIVVTGCAAADTVLY